MGWFKKLTGISSKSITKPLASIAGGLLGFSLGGPVGAALGSGAGSMLTGGNLGTAITSGLGAYGIGSLYNSVTGAGTGALGSSWNPAVSPPVAKSTALANYNSSGGFLSGLGSLLGSSGIGLGSIVQGAIGLGSDYLSQQQQLANQMQINDKTFAQNQLLQQQAYNQNLAMWSAQNEYNSPLAQMNRLKSAGLNPNLVYGGGNVTGNTASSAPQFSPAQHEAPTVSRLGNFMDTIMNYQQIQNQALQNDFTRARIELAYEASDRANRELAMQDRYNHARLAIMRNEMGYTQERSKEMDIWRKYTDALEEYHRREKEIPWMLRSSYAKKYLPRVYNYHAGRYPSIKDFDDGSL